MKYFLIATLVFSLDRISKLIIGMLLPCRESVIIVKNIVAISHKHNNRGMSSKLELSTSKLLFLQAQANLIQSIYDSQIAEAELNRAMGK